MQSSSSSSSKPFGKGKQKERDTARSNTRRTQTDNDNGWGARWETSDSAPAKAADDDGWGAGWGSPPPPRNTRFEKGKAAPLNEEQPADNDKPPCFFWSMGSCDDGDKCEFYHAGHPTSGEKAAAQNESTSMSSKFRSFLVFHGSRFTDYFDLKDKKDTSEYLSTQYDFDTKSTKGSERGSSPSKTTSVRLPSVQAPRPAAPSSKNSQWETSDDNVSHGQPDADYEGEGEEEDVDAVSINIRIALARLLTYL